MPLIPPHQFIDGSSLIRDKTNNEIIKMKNDIDELMGKMGGVNTLHDKTEERLKAGRESVEMLAGAKPLMKKLLTLLDLPARIAAVEAGDDAGGPSGTVDMDRYGALVEDIRHAWPVLTKYKEFEKVKNVHDRVETAIEGIRERLLSGMLQSRRPKGSGKIPAADAGEIGKMLAMLPMCDVHRTLKELVDDRTASVLSELDDAEQALAEGGDGDALARIRSLDSCILGEISQMHRAVYELLDFCARGCVEEEDGEGARDETFDYPSLEAYFRSACGRVYSKYTSVVVECAKRCGPLDASSAGLSTETFIEYMQTFAKDVGSIVDLFPTNPWSEIGCRLCEQMAMDRVQAECSMLLAKTSQALEEAYHDFSLVAHGEHDGSRTSGLMLEPVLLLRIQSAAAADDDELIDDGDEDEDDARQSAYSSLPGVSNRILQRMLRITVENIGTILRGRPVWKRTGPERALSWKNVVVHAAKDEMAAYVAKCCALVKGLHIDDLSPLSGIPGEGHVVIGGEPAVAFLLATCFGKGVLKLLDSAFAHDGVMNRVRDEDSDTVEVFDFEMEGAGWEQSDDSRALLADSVMSVQRSCVDHMVRLCSDWLSRSDWSSPAGDAVRLGLLKCLDAIDSLSAHLSSLSTNGEGDPGSVKTKPSLANLEHVASSMLSSHRVRDALDALAGRNTLQHDLAGQLDAAMADASLGDVGGRDSVWDVSPQKRAMPFFDSLKDKVLSGVLIGVLRSILDEILARNSPFFLRRVQCELTLFVCRTSSIDGMPSLQAAQLQSMAEEVFYEAVKELQKHDPPSTAEAAVTLTAVKVAELLTHV